MPYGDGDDAGVVAIVWKLGKWAALAAMNAALRPFGRQYERVAVVEWKPGTDPEFESVGMEWRRIVRCQRGHRMSIAAKESKSDVFCMQCLADGHPQVGVR